MEAPCGERLQAASAHRKLPAMTSRSYWTAVWCGFLVLTIGLGVRQSFGIFLKPVSAELHVGRELFSFGTAAVDAADGRCRALRPAGCATASARPPTIAGGGVLYVLGMIVTATMHDGAMLILGNILVGVGLSAASFGPVLGVILRVAPPAKAALAVGICSAGGSFGQFFIVPLASVLQDYFGDWRPTMWALTALAVLIMLLPIGLNDSQQIAAAKKRPRRLADVARRRCPRPSAQRSYVLLVVGYFVCGFHVAFVGGHLPAYISDKGIGLSLFGITLSPAELGGWSIGMVGLFNIAGAILWSAMGDRHKRKNLLSLLYLLRSLVFLGFVLAPLSAASVLIFAARAGLPVAGHRAAHHLAGRLHLRAGPPHHAERRRLLRPSGRQLLRRLGRRPAVRPAGQLRHDVVDLDRARPRLGRCCTGRSSRSGSRGRPPRCRSRHDARLALRSCCGAPPRWWWPRSPCRSCCGG